MLVVVSWCEQTLRFWPVMVSWKLLLFWAVRPKWAVTERLFLAKPLISCHDGSETNRQCHCMGETSFWMDFKFWCITESSCLPSSERIAVGAHPPHWRIKTEGYFWSCGKANPTLRAEAGMSDHNVPHLCSSSVGHCDFPQPKGHPTSTGEIGVKPETWAQFILFSLLRMHSAALNWDFPATKSLLITQSRPLDTWNFTWAPALWHHAFRKTHLLERKLVHRQDFKWQRIHRPLALFSPHGNMECFFPVWRLGMFWHCTSGDGECKRSRNAQGLQNLWQF